MTASGAGARASRRSVLPARALPALLGVLGSAGLIAVLEATPRLGLVDRRFLPPFSEMARALGDQVQQDAFWSALGATLRGWGIGLAVAAGAAIVVGTVIGSSHLLRALTSSTIEFLRPIPSVTLIPLAVLLYGSQMRATLMLVIYAAFWQMLVQVLHGVQDVDPVARDTARSYRFGPLRRIRSVLWPTALPYVLTGFRLAAAVALILEVSGELIIGTPGLGKLIATAQTSGAVASLYAIVLVTGVLGVLVNLLARLVERRALRWHPSVRREAAA